MPPEVVTETIPVVVPAGTSAVRYVPVTDAGFATVPLKDTVLLDVNPCPRNSIVLPTLPVYGSTDTNGVRLLLKR